MTLKDLPPKLIEMFLAIRAQILIRKKHDKNGRGIEIRSGFPLTHECQLSRMEKRSYYEQSTSN